MSDETMHRILEEVGYIRGTVDAMDSKLAAQNGSIAELKKTVGRHEVILGKVGLVFSGIIFAVTLAFNAVIDWVNKMRS